MREVTVTRGQLLVEEISLAIPTLAPEYRGIYAKLAAFGTYSPTTTTPWNGSDGDKTTIHFGFGGTVRVGYSFDIFSLELVGAFGVDHYEAPLHLASTASAEVTGFDTFVGLGGRVTSHGTTVRGTFGIAPGLAIHVISLSDGSGSVSNACYPGSLSPCGSGGSGGSSSSYSPSAGYVAPGFLFDGGMLLGSTPGTRFYLGLQAWVDFAPTVYVGPDPSAAQGVFPASAFFKGGTLKLVGGPQLYVGPTLGVQLGH